MPLLEVRDLRKSYGDLEVVRGRRRRAGRAGISRAGVAGLRGDRAYIALVLTRRRLLF